MSKGPLVSRSSGKKLGSLLTRDRVKTIDVSTSADPDLEAMLGVVRRAQKVASAVKSRPLERASKFLS